MIVVLIKTLEVHVIKYAENLIYNYQLRLAAFCLLLKYQATVEFYLIYIHIHVFLISF